MAWVNPKTNWGQPGQTVPGADDFNRIEGNTLYLKDEVDLQNDALTSHKAAAAPHSGHETPAEAQAKADAAESAAKSYADGVAAGEAGAVRAELEAHLSEIATQENLGHVKVDGETITASNGIISAQTQIVDTVTGDKWKWGMENGIVFLERW